MGPEAGEACSPPVEPPRDLAAELIRALALVEELQASRQQATTELQLRDVALEQLQAERCQWDAERASHLAAHAASAARESAADEARRRAEEAKAAAQAAHDSDLERLEAALSEGARMRAELAETAAAQHAASSQVIALEEAHARAQVEGATHLRELHAAREEQARASAELVDVVARAGHLEEAVRAHEEEMRLVERSAQEQLAAAQEDQLQTALVLRRTHDELTSSEVKRLAEREAAHAEREALLVELAQCRRERDAAVADAEELRATNSALMAQLAAVATNQPEHADLISEPPVVSATKATPVEADDDLPLYDWQRDALAAWDQAGRSGVVQAVTGAGKTRLGVWAARRELADGGKVLVVVPTIELQRQWRRVLTANLPAVHIGLLGDGHQDTLRSHDLVIATPISAANHRPLMAPGQSGLLVADECHRYGAESWSQALDPAFTSRLGLTATYERGDSGNRDYLDPFFAGVVFDLWYDRALRDGVIAPFRVALVGVDFDPAERAQYDEHDEAARQARIEVFTYADPPEHSFAEWMKYVNKLAEGGPSVERRAKQAARRYLNAFSKRRELLASAECKVPVMRQLAPAVTASGGTLVFTQTKASAEAAAQLFAEAGVDTTAVYSGLDDDERRVRMEGFRQGDVQLVSAPKLLDEGIDVPEADLGIIVAASRSQRQMIQRLGRVVRVKSDGRSGRLVVLYVKGTTEDPSAHEDSEFLGRCLPHAEDVLHVDSSADPVEELLDFLVSGQRPDPPVTVPAQPVGPSRTSPPVEDEPTLAELLDLEDVEPWSGNPSELLLESELKAAMRDVRELDFERDKWDLLAASEGRWDELTDGVDDPAESSATVWARMGVFFPTTAE